MPENQTFVLQVSFNFENIHFARCFKVFLNFLINNYYRVLKQTKVAKPLIDTSTFNSERLFSIICVGIPK